MSDLILRLLRSLRPFFVSSVAALPRSVFRGEDSALSLCRAEHLPELFDTLVILFDRLSNRDRELELGLIHLRREGFDIRSRRNSPERAQALLRRFGQKIIDE